MNADTGEQLLGTTELGKCVAQVAHRGIDRCQIRRT
jgi:hypothetical protein